MIEINQRKLCEENCFVCNYETVSDEEREEYIQDRYNEKRTETYAYYLGKWYEIE